MRLIPEDTLRFLMQRPGEIPPPGNDRWGKSVLLQPGKPSYCVVNVGYSGSIPTPWALQLSFSLDGVSYTNQIPAGYLSTVQVDVIRAADVKAGSLESSYFLKQGDSLPFCTLVAAALTVNVSVLGEPTLPIYVQAIAAPTTMVDCESITNTGNTAWNDVNTLRVAASTVGQFLAIPAVPSTRQIFIQNNSAVDLLIGFGANIPSLGPPPIYNLILPGGMASTYESFPGAFVGDVRAIFAAGGSATDYAVFTRAITV